MDTHSQLRDGDDHIQLAAWRAAYFSRLTNPNSAVRLEAVRELSKLKAPEVAFILGDCLSDCETTIRIEAAKALEGLPPNSKVPIEELIESLADEERIVCQSCRATLENADPQWLTKIPLATFTALIEKANPAGRENLAEVIGQCGVSVGPWLPAFILPWVIKESDRSVVRALGRAIDYLATKLTEDYGEIKFIPKIIQKAKSCDRLDDLAAVASVLAVFGTHASDATDIITRGLLLPSRETGDYFDIGESLDSLYRDWRSLRTTKEVKSVLQATIENAKIASLENICLDWPTRDINFLHEIKQHTSCLLAIRVIQDKWIEGPQAKQWVERLLPRLVLQTGHDWMDNYIRHAIMEELIAANPNWRTSEAGQLFLNKLIEMLRTHDAATARGALCAIASYYQNGAPAIPPLRTFASNSQFKDDHKLKALAHQVLALIGDRNSQYQAMGAGVLCILT